MKKPTYDYRLSYFFGPPARFSGGIIAIAGVVGVVTGGPPGVILLLMGLMMITTHSGIELYVPDCQYRLYYRILWLVRLGKRKDFTRYNRLMIKYWKGTHRIFSRSNRQVDVQDFKFVVYATGSQKDDQVPLYMTKDKDLAFRKAKEISLSAHLEFTEGFGSTF